MFQVDFQVQVSSQILLHYYTQMHKKPTQRYYYQSWADTSHFYIHRLAIIAKATITWQLLRLNPTKLLTIPLEIREYQHLVVM